MTWLLFLLVHASPPAHASASVARSTCDQLLGRISRLFKPSAASPAVLADPRAWLLRASVDPNSLRLKITRTEWEDVVAGRPQPRGFIQFEFLSERGEAFGEMHFERHQGSWLSHSGCTDAFRGKGFGTFMYAVAGHVFIRHFQRKFISIPRITEARVRSDGATQLWLRLVRLGLGQIIADDEVGPHFQVVSASFEPESSLSRYVDSLLHLEGDFDARLPRFVSGDIRTLLAGPDLSSASKRTGPIRK